MTPATITHPDIHISGDVRIDPRAVIAPGVILQATDHNHIAIAANACIGAGCIIQAHHGNIEIHAGGIIGAATLILGKSTIGENVCIGYGTTIFRASIVAGTILPPNSLVGDTSRQATAHQTATPAVPPTATAQPTPTTNEAIDPWQEVPPRQPSPPPPEPTPTAEPPIESPVNTEVAPPVTEPEMIPTTPEAIAHPPEPPTEKNPKPPVVGQVYINQLLMTLFPQQNSIKTIDWDAED